MNAGLLRHATSPPTCSGRTAAGDCGRDGPLAAAFVCRCEAWQQPHVRSNTSTNEMLPTLRSQARRRRCEKVSSDCQRHPGSRPKRPTWRSVVRYGPKNSRIFLHMQRGNETNLPRLVPGPSIRPSNDIDTVISATANARFRAFCSNCAAVRRRTSCLGCGRCYCSRVPASADNHRSIYSAASLQDPISFSRLRRTKGTFMRQSLYSRDGTRVRLQSDSSS